MLISVPTTAATLLSLLSAAQLTNVKSAIPSAAWRQTGKINVRIANIGSNIVYCETGGAVAAAASAAPIAVSTGTLQIETDDLAKISLIAATGATSAIITI
jgi:hypothetical protein